MTTKSDREVLRGLQARGRTRSFIPGRFERGRVDHFPVEAGKEELDKASKCPICKVGQIEDKGGAMRACNYCGQRYAVRSR